MSGMIRTLPATWSLPRIRVRPEALIRLGLTILVVGVGFAIAFRGDGGDAYSYWSANLGPHLYDSGVGEYGAFLYSPIVAQLTAPFTALPFPTFFALLTAANLAALLWLLGPAWALAALIAFPPLGRELGVGNIHLLLGFAAVAGIFRPGWWALPLLTKITPSVGLVWFAVRREWRPLAIALMLPAALVAASFVIAPSLWFAWIELLREPVAPTAAGVTSAVPLALRLASALALVVLAARREWRWLVPVACWLALPIAWPSSLAMLLAAGRDLRAR